MNKLHKMTEKENKYIKIKLMIKQNRYIKMNMNH